MSDNFFVPTGSIIKEYLEEEGINQKECAQRTGISEKHLSNLLNGKSRLTEEVAIKLENIIQNVPASYWLNYESKYREYLKREEMDIDKYSEDELKSLAEKFRFSNVFSGLNWSLKKQANEMLKILRLSSFKQFDTVYSNLNVDFMEDGGDVEAIAIWLNLAREEVEIQNDDLTIIEYDKESLIKSLPKLKLLALNKEYEKAIISIRKFLNRLGIYLVFCDAITNSKVRGALTTYKKNPAIYLSGRFKTHDHVWFALMHEIGHLILHYSTNESIVSFEDSFSKIDIPIREKEANKFARDFFISENDYNNFIEKVRSEFTQKEIENFAQSQNILPGIVLARLQHDGYIEYNKFSRLINR